jgi:hypothetical protein
VRGVANPAGGLVLPVFVLVNYDLYQEHDDAAGSRKRHGSGEIIYGF